LMRLRRSALVVQVKHALHEEIMMLQRKGVLKIHFFSPTHKRTEGRAPVWGSEFTSNRRRTTGGDPAETAVG
jgi:hypothetical protein